MPKVSEEHLKARRQQILDAAATCFARQGFHQTTMDDICRQADLSLGAIYRYFESKEALIIAIGEEYHRRSLEVVEAFTQQSGDQMMVEKLIGLFINALDDGHMLALETEVWAEGLRNPEIRELLQRRTEAWRNLLTETYRLAQENQEITTDLEPMVIADLMSALFHGVMTQVTFQPALEVRNYQPVLEAMMRGLRPTKPDEDSEP